MKQKPGCVPSSHASILAADEPPPVAVYNPSGRSPFLLLGDHAGNRVPLSLGDLGLAPEERARHIAWDIGIAGLGRQLADRLDSCFIHQNYSRLVIDCNRSPQSSQAIMAISDGTAVPANRSLDPAAAQARIDAIHAPYHSAIHSDLERRRLAKEQIVLVALHSFTPAMNGIDRPWQIGVLYDQGDRRFAKAMLGALSKQGDLCVGDNRPYTMDSTDFTIPFHAFDRRLPYAELEIRQDLLLDSAGIDFWCARVGDALDAALREIDLPTADDGR